MGMIGFLGSTAEQPDAETGSQFQKERTRWPYTMTFLGVQGVGFGFGIEGYKPRQNGSGDSGPKGPK